MPARGQRLRRLGWSRLQVPEAWITQGQLFSETTPIVEEGK
jgi:hypothetical protein